MNKILKIYLITLPLNAFYFSIHNYRITIPLVITALLSIIIILIRRPVEKKLQLTYFIFIFWIFISTFIRYGIAKYILSIFQFILMTLPVMVDYNKDDVKDFTKYLLIGFYITIPFALYGLGLNIPFISDFLGQRQGPTRKIYEGINRTYATFTEPSYYAIYLNVILYALVDRTKPPNRYIIPLVLFFIITTFSLGGYILSLFIGSQYIFKRKRYIFYILIVLILIIVVEPVLITRLLIRVRLTIFSLLTHDLYGSEGSRINSLYVMFKYFMESGKTGLLIGTGFTYYSEWLINMFGNDPLLHYSTGEIFNTFAAVGISNGIIGLVLYILYINQIRKSHYITNKYIQYFIVINFVISGLQGYFLWSILIILKMNNTANKFHGPLKQQIQVSP